MAVSVEGAIVEDPLCKIRFEFSFFELNDQSLGSSRGSVGALYGAPMGKMGETNLGRCLVFSCIFNNISWYFWGFNYSKMAN